MMHIEIREESPSDWKQIRLVTEAAFKDMPYSDGSEPDIIERLRSFGALALSLVAFVDGRLVGHAGFSPAEAGDLSGPWFALGPVSVVPDYQRLGIGLTLIRRGLSELKNRGALGCILVGDPVYYQQFDFKNAPQYVPDGEPAEYFMVKPFTDFLPKGQFAFHRAFYDEAQ